MLNWHELIYKIAKVESIIRKELKKIFKKDVGRAAGLLRLHFHDCFVQGCDSSVLLDGSAGGPKIVHKQCGRVVSCSDIVAIAARDSVFLTGLDYDVLLGRRDGVNFARVNQTFVDLVGPDANTTTILVKLARKKLDATDAVALSGSHTIGIGHTTSFTDRLYPTQDPTMDKTFAKSLKRTCPKPDTRNTTFLDIRSPNKFDNNFHDQDGELNVLTGKQGEIRANCSARNSDNKLLVYVAEEEMDHLLK
ncbi:hypothetical protein MANES_18G094101v8 [Manihot esculenta]|uniref:Uncharacterized protein n=1 Tax=Manihot esculenta TaxID=3983 RepID=A0ACB7G0B0_MANES|nr:hypothetical protein MANES_18G094101v8 [Manihot esculenta]